MKKKDFFQLLDNYDEKASWAFLQGYWPSDAVNNLHQLYSVDLLNLKDDDEIPDPTLQKIKEIASHYNEQWSDPAAELLKEIEDKLENENKSKSYTINR